MAAGEEKEKSPEEKRKDVANTASAALDSDILIINYEIWPPIDFSLVRQLSKRRTKKNLVLILVTEGGSSDSAFRIMRALQKRYEYITVIVSGWCKSAGTLMCIGANEIQFGDLGEMGPLDVQIVKADEIDEEKSGLAADAAFEKLQQEASKLFSQFVRDAGSMGYRITLKTAAEISRHITVGLVSPIFEKLDPVTIGEDYRSNRLAFAYAERLNIKAKNLVREQDFDALEALLSNYQSHGFVIDLTEAENLFREVKPICAELTSLIDLLGGDAIIPRNSRRKQSPKLEYLNDEPPEKPTVPARSGHGAPEGDRGGAAGSGNGADHVPGNPETGGGAEPAPPQQPAE